MPLLVTTSVSVPRRNGKTCTTFFCQEEDCFKGQDTVAVCPEDLNFCKVKWSSSGYTAGCSEACVAETPKCHGAGAGAGSCYLEFCQASASGSCL